jgi:exodeoxyribonuclease V beta subunit
MAEPNVFDVAGPLPTGLLALEASAGTGKTYALTALAVRFIAEADVQASELCIVSFTVPATAELRGRVRARIIDALDHLRRGAARQPDAGPGDPSDGSVLDPVLAAVADTGDDPDECERRIRRLSDALADFDAATITTIHGFCSRVLASAGLGTDDPGISDGVADVDEVVNDLYLARLAGGDAEDLLEISPDRIAKGVRARLTMPDAHVFRPELLPEPVTANKLTEQARRRRSLLAADLVEDAVAEVVRRRGQQRLRTFDGILAEARDHLRSPEGRATIASLRERYRVVLIDEFQDTDRVQWDIFRRAFVEPVEHAAPGGEAAEARAMVLVGDPKQSIYRFRSAELSAYLLAVQAAGEQVATLGTNWRSDAPLLRALECLFTGFTFGDPAVAFQRVAPADTHLTTGLEGTGTAPFDLRWVPPRPDGSLSAPAARRAIRADVVRVISDLLRSGVVVTPDGDRRPVIACDIAVLTRSNADAALIASTLAEAGIPAATASSNSVLDTDAARQWEILLRALERPGASGPARAAALGWFIGRTPAELVDADDDAIAELHELLRSWAQLCAERGVPHLLAHARAEGLHLRLLSSSGGDRHLTDVDHIAELLQAHTGGRPASASALLAAMVELARRSDGDEVASDALARRIDRDDDAVQVLTVHKAKGLEFSVVLCPFLWSSSGGASGVPHAHRPEAGGRQLDSTWVAGIGPLAWTRQLRDLARAEQNGEARRLLYVALTRARHRCVVWWPSLSKNGSGGPLGELLAHAAGLDAVPTSSCLLDGVVDDGDGSISVTEVSPPSAPSHAVDTRPGSEPALEVAMAERELDQAWRVWSFTSITSTADARSQPGVGAHAGSSHADQQPEAPVEGGADEPAVDAAMPVASAAPPVTLLADAPAGTAFGTLVHGVFEHCDFTHHDLRAHLGELCDTALRHRPMRIAPDALAAGLADAIESPLGGPVGEFRLRDLGSSDRLDELEFHVPLGRLRATDIGSVLAGHLDSSDPLLDWARQLAASRSGASVSELTGFDFDLTGRLIGSIDLVARTPAADGSCRFWVADYKTNQLGPQSPYDADALVKAMVHHQYPLQASLYLVALHRYLRWRLPGYRPEHHLGGAAYLFVRGMDPDRSAGDARGVLWWEPSTSAVLALDHLLSGAS